MFIVEIVIIKVIKQKNGNCCKIFAIYVKMMNILMNNVHENVKRMMSLWRGYKKCGTSGNVSGFKKGKINYLRPNNYKIIFDNQ
jgi:hypothetical protein